MRRTGTWKFRGQSTSVEHVIGLERPETRVFTVIYIYIYIYRSPAFHSSWAAFTRHRSVLNLSTGPAFSHAVSLPWKSTKQQATSLASGAMPNNLLPGTRSPPLEVMGKLLCLFLKSSFINQAWWHIPAYNPSVWETEESSKNKYKFIITGQWVFKKKLH